MTDLNKKANYISAIVLGLLWLVLELLPMDSPIKLVARSLVVFTAVLGYVAYEKKEPWNLIFWLWSAFFLPLFSIQFLTVVFLGFFVSVEIIAVWGIPIFLSLMPSTLWVMMKWFKGVFADACMQIHSSPFVSEKIQRNSRG